MKNSETVGNKLYTFRKKAGLSQEELAEKLGVSRQAISKWECGESLPDVDNLITIAKVYGVSLDELVDNSPTVTVDEPKTEALVVETPPQYKTKEEIDDEEKEDEQEAAYFSYDGTPADTKRKILRVLHALPYPILTTIAFLVWGFVWEGWAVAWTLFVTIPVYYSILNCIRLKKFAPFAYPVLVAAVYLFIGMQWDLWHPWWILFITIPVYYAIAEAIDRK